MRPNTKETLPPHLVNAPTVSAFTACVSNRVRATVETNERARRTPRFEAERTRCGLLQKQIQKLRLQQQSLRELHTKELEMLNERVSRSERLLLLLSEEVEALDSQVCDDTSKGPEQPEKPEISEPIQRVPGLEHRVDEPYTIHKEENALEKEAVKVSEYRPTGFLRIADVNSSGKFVRIFNSSRAEAADMSGCVIQQWVEGHPIALFRFPLGTALPPLQHITIWASAAEVPCESPTELHWKEQVHFRTGPECTTLLTRPGGQPIDWFRIPHRVPLVPDQEQNISQHQQALLQKPTSAEEPVSESIPLGRKELYAPEEGYAEPAPSRSRTRPPSAPSNLGPRTWTITSSAKKDGMNQHKHTGRARSLDRFTAGGLQTGSVLPHTADSLCFMDGLSASSSRQTSSPRPVMPFPTRLDTKSPVVALLARKSARSMYGFKFMSYPPFTLDVHVIRR